MITITKLLCIFGTVLLFATVQVSFGQDTPAQSRPAVPENAPAATSAPQQQSPTVGDGIGVKVVAAGLGGFLAWILTKGLGLWLLREKLKSYLLLIINGHLKQYNDMEKWLVVVREKTIKEGSLVTQAATYTKDDLADLTEVRQDCFKLLFKNELLGVTKFVHRLWEIEALMDGFCGSLDQHKSTGITLDASEVEFLQRKQERILSYIHILPSSIQQLKDLPLDYSGIQGAETLVTSSNAAPPPAPGKGVTNRRKKGMRRAGD